MEPAHFRDEVERGRMASRIAANKAEADRFSALGYPSFILGDFPLTGIQPIETMRKLLARFIERRVAEPRA
jgi:protein-disulfide isomerase